MTWTKISDNLLDEFDRLGLSRSAQLLHIEALVFCNRLSTDGRVLARQLRRFSSAGDDEVAELESAGLWAPLAEDEGWQIPWDDQLKATEVQKRRDDARARQRVQRQHKAGDHGECNPRYCRSVTRDTERDQRRESRRPDPSRPAPKVGGSGEDETCTVCGLVEKACRERHPLNDHAFESMQSSPPQVVAAVALPTHETHDMAAPR